MKMVKAVSPYNHSGGLNFKKAPYEAWVKLGGQIAKPHYPVRALHSLAFRWELPTLWKKNTEEARLRFVEPVSISFDTFLDYIRYEIIPFVWDCWPRYFEKMCRWIERHQVKTAIFTSSQMTERIKLRFPEINVMYCPEAVDTSLYQAGKLLKDRQIDLLEYGRNSNINVNMDGRLNYVCTKVGEKSIYTNEQLYTAMEDAKVTIALPRSMTQPEVAGDIETLTQRYWEAMLSRMVMVGHAPKELVDFVGYNPVIEMDEEHIDEQIQDIMVHIDDYQSLVNKNREMALQKGDWTIRMKDVMPWLENCGYKV